VLQVLDKMLKQRRDSESQYRGAGRDDLAAQEALEIGIISEYMPAALGAAELATLIDETVAQSGATDMKDMGKVMAALRPLVQGRADMGAVSSAVKARLAG
jgi:uncharacterized protein YqeY